MLGAPRYRRFTGPQTTPEVRVTRTAAVSTEDQLTELTAQHRELEARLKDLDKHLALTPSEQVEYARLKKEKLRTKDRIFRLRVTS
jgi:hypothetical protein